MFVFTRRNISRTRGVTICRNWAALTVRELRPSSVLTEKVVSSFSPPLSAPLAYVRLTCSASTHDVFRPSAISLVRIFPPTGIVAVWIAPPPLKTAISVVPPPISSNIAPTWRSSERSVAGEQQPRGAVGEHHVPPGVARGGDRLQRARPQVEDLAVGDPLVRLGVPGVRGGRGHPRLGHPVDQRLRPGGDQPPGLRRHPPAIPAKQHVQRLLLLRAERDLRAERLAQRDRLRVMVTVHVGDEEPAHVAQAGPDPRERSLELAPGLVAHPARVDHHQAVAGLDHVGVDGAQAVERQGQRDPVDAGRDRVGTLLSPPVPVVAGRPGRGIPVAQVREPHGTILAYQAEPSGAWPTGRPGAEPAPGPRWQAGSDAGTPCRGTGRTMVTCGTGPRG